MATATAARIPDRDRRSREQQAPVILRLSHDEREALHEVAAAEGLSLAALLRRECHRLIGRSA